MNFCGILWSIVFFFLNSSVKPPNEVFVRDDSFFSWWDYFRNIQKKMSSEQLASYAAQQKVTSVLTTSNGAPIDDKTNSMTAGPRGPIVLQDFTLIDEIAHFDRERIPERVVHAKGAGAFGYFEVH